MLGFILKLILTGIAAVFVSRVIPGITVASITDGILLALVLALLNAIVRPILVFFTIPITILTLGLFLLVINIIIIYLADAILDGFDVNGVIAALIFSLVMSVVTAIIDFARK